MVDKGVGLVFTLRKHWKKSIFAGCLLTCGFHYGSKRFREYLIRREYFLEAKRFGEEACSPIEKPRRLYVVLNPQAGNSNAKKLFQKNAAPIFYLAGIDLTYIQTDYEGHSKTIVNYFDPIIDGIVVAGGDGTLHEVITGILRQPEQDVVVNKPIGFIPLGKRSNFVFKKLFGQSSNQVRSICDSAMSIVKGSTKTVAVISIKTAEKTVFALSSIHVGANNSIKQQIDDGRFWLLGPIKKYFTIVWKTIIDWPPLDEVKVSSPSVVPIQNPSLETLSRIPNFSTMQVSCESSDNNHFEDTIKNNTKHTARSLLAEDYLMNCNIKDSNSVPIVECTSKAETSLLQHAFTTTSMSLYLQENYMGSYFVLQNLKLTQSRKDFIRYGFEWLQNNFEYVPSELSDTVMCTEVNLTPEDSQNLTYGIDGEIFDARPITITIAPKRINMFCRSN